MSDKIHKETKLKDKKKTPTLINDSFIHSIKLDGPEAQKIRDSKLDQRQIIHERI